MCHHLARDCSVSEWSYWSGCAKPCQPSVRVRVRHTEQHPVNSGEPCPSLEQQAGCREYRDHRGRHCGLTTGTHTNKNAPKWSLPNFLTGDFIGYNSSHRMFFSRQDQLSSPALSLVKEGQDMTAMEYLWTQGKFHFSFQ